MLISTADCYWRTDSK